MIPFLLDHSPTRRINHLEKREKLGLNPAPKAQSRSREPLPESADAYQRVEVSTTYIFPLFIFFLLSYELHEHHANAQGGSDEH